MGNKKGEEGKKEIKRGGRKNEIKRGEEGKGK